MSLESALPSINPLVTVASTETGFTLTNASSDPGSVSGSTNTFDKNVRGKMVTNPAFITALGAPHDQTDGHEDPRQSESETTTRPPSTRPQRPRVEELFRHVLDLSIPRHANVLVAGTMPT